ncbi:MAG: AAA family ATPase [Candidatus Thorarchaeota archaeon]|nr:AAA family ATPase [Candidatus Thorarchaeota archaeon]
MESPLWSVKYRPEKWDDFVGQDAAIEQLRSFASTKTCPNMILVGPYGTGKTRAAELFAHEFLGADFDANYLWLNVRDLRFYPISKAKRPIQALAKLGREERTPLDEYMSFVYKEAKGNRKLRGRTGDPNRSELLHAAIRVFASTLTVATDLVKILVLDEADALDNNMQQALRRTMELYSDATRFILVTPSLAGWSPAIISRCVVLKFSTIAQESIMQHLSMIAKAESVDITEKALTAIAREADGDLRRAINLLQVAAAGRDTVTEDDVYEVSETYLSKQIRAIVSLTIDGSFVKARDMLRSLQAYDGYSPSDVISAIQRDILRRPFDRPLLNQLIDRIAEIDSRLPQSKNPFMQLDALLASIWDLTTTTPDSTS